MWIFRKRPPALDRWPAIPLTVDELGACTALLDDAARAWTVNRPDLGGGWRRSESDLMNALARRAGVAAGLGHSTTPLLISELGDLDRAAADVRHWEPTARRLHAHALLLTRLYALAGLAAVRGWAAIYGPVGLQWPNEPPSPDGQALPAIGDGR